VLLSTYLLIALWPGNAAERFRAGLAERVRQLPNTSGRSYIWQTAGELFIDRPWLGWGPDTLRLVFGRHRPVAFTQREWNVTPARAHNVVLHILATQGVVGGVALLVLLLGIGRAARQAWRKASGEDRLFVGSLIACMAAFGVAQIFGFVVIGCGSLFFVCMGLLAAEAAPAAAPPCEGPLNESPAPARRLMVGVWFGSLAIAVVAFVVVEIVWPLAASYACRQGDLLQTQDVRAALRHYEQAVHLDPADDRNWAQLAAAVGRAGDGRGYLMRARQALQQAIGLVPVDAYHHANLARVLSDQARQGDAQPQAAFDEWQTALQTDSRNPGFLAEAARTALVLGDNQRLEIWAGRALELYPGFAAPLAHLGAADLRKGRFSQAVERLRFALQSNWHGDTEGAEHACAILAAAYLGLRDFAQAQQFCRILLQHHPDWPLAHVLLAQALEGQGLTSDACSEYQQALVLDPTYTPAQSALRRLQIRSFQP
jgi:tetratricopeptide (TPR) repeat protein